MGVSLTGESANSCGSATEVSKLMASFNTHLMYGEPADGEKERIRPTGESASLVASAGSATARSRFRDKSVIKADDRQLRSVS